MFKDCLQHMLKAEEGKLRYRMVYAQYPFYRRGPQPETLVNG